MRHALPRLLPLLALLACSSDDPALGAAADAGTGPAASSDAAAPSAAEAGAGPAAGASDAGSTGSGNAADGAVAAARGAGTGGDSGASPGTTAGRLFPNTSFFYTDVSKAPVATYSAAAIAALRSAGGFGNGDRFQIDFSLDVLTADSATPRRVYTPRTEANGFPATEYAAPDCDDGEVPIPPDGNIEGEDGYVCTGDGDCHLLVRSATDHTLYEMWRANIDAHGFAGACLVRWDTARPVGNQGRGLQCTSADAAGFPITPLLFNADEVKRGEIDHAIRFILPNDRVRRGFVPPATHGSKTTGGESAPSYGVHLRLRADYPLASLPSEGARVVARALQRYGMYHADGGNIALTAQSDRHTAAKWEGLLGPRDLVALRVEDFEVIDHGAQITLTFDCVRSPQ
jgi:hypothetical protein